MKKFIENNSEAFDFGSLIVLWLIFMICVVISFLIYLTP